MEPLTIKEFIRYILLKSSIKRFYSPQESKKDTIKLISEKFCKTDDIFFIKKSSKRFVGGFIPYTDNFVANFTQSIGIELSTIPRLVEIHGSINEKENKIVISVDYKWTSLLKKQLMIFSIMNITLLSLILLNIKDIYRALALAFIMVFTTSVILASYYNKIKNQIRYTEKYLLFNESL